MRWWKDSKCSWISRTNRVKKNGHSTKRYLQKISIKILTKVFTDLERKIFCFIWKHHARLHTHTYKPTQNRKAKAFLNNKRPAGVVPLPYFKLNYRTTLIIAARHCHKNWHIDQWNCIEDIDINLHTYGHLFSDKERRDTTSDAGQTIKEFK